MKITAFIIFLIFLNTSIVAQNSPCYDRLLQRGIEEFEKKNYGDAILKWQIARDNCPDVTTDKRKILDNWITKANEKIKLSPPDTTKASLSIKTLIKRDTLIKTVFKRDTVYVVKKDTIYVDKPIEKKVYVDRPVEKIIYRDKPEPYHPYGKGNCRILVYTTCSSGGVTKVWIDGKYRGSFNKYRRSSYGSPECDDEDYVFITTIAGVHHIQTRNENNATTDFYITVEEDRCSKQAITCN